MSAVIRLKDFKYKGKSDEELKAMSLNEFAKITNARVRRSINKGFSEVQKITLTKINDHLSGKRKKPVKTHSRDLPIVPQMLGSEVHIYNGKTFQLVEITSEKLGHFLGEFAVTRKRVTHKAPGVGATRSSKFQSVK